MQILERIKLIVGLILVALVIIGAVFYYLLSFKIINSSNFYQFNYSWTRGSDGGASNAPLFFGFVAIAACYLLASVRKKDN